MGKKDKNNVMSKLTKAVQQKGNPILHPNALNKVIISLIN